MDKYFSLVKVYLLFFMLFKKIAKQFQAEHYYKAAKEIASEIPLPHSLGKSIGYHQI